VRTLVPLTREGRGLRAGQRAGRRETSRCFALMEQLLKQGESAVGILLVAIIPTRAQPAAGEGPDAALQAEPAAAAVVLRRHAQQAAAEATDHLPRKKDGTINAFALGLASVHARKF